MNVKNWNYKYKTNQKELTKEQLLANQRVANHSFEQKESLDQCKQRCVKYIWKPIFNAKYVKLKNIVNSLVQ